jgi:phage terminase large subunit
MSASSSVLKIPTAKIFEPLLQPARYKGAFGGRGSGKRTFENVARIIKR